MLLRIFVAVNLPLNSKNTFIPITHAIGHSFLLILTRSSLLNNSYMMTSYVSLYTLEISQYLAPFSIILTSNSCVSLYTLEIFQYLAPFSIIPTSNSCVSLYTLGISHYPAPLSIIPTSDYLIHILTIPIGQMKYISLRASCVPPPIPHYTYWPDEVCQFACKLCATSNLFLTVISDFS